MIMEVFSRSSFRYIPHNLPACVWIFVISLSLCNVGGCEYSASSAIVWNQVSNSLHVSRSLILWKVSKAYNEFPQTLAADFPLFTGEMLSRCFVSSAKPNLIPKLRSGTRLTCRPGCRFSSFARAKKMLDTASERLRNTIWLNMNPRKISRCHSHCIIIHHLLFNFITGCSQCGVNGSRIPSDS